MPFKIIPVGTRFGKLKVISEANPVLTKDKRHRRMFTCQCDCGNITTVALGHLKSGHTQSCNCINVEVTIRRSYKHGGSKSSEYRTWIAMRLRCEQATDKDYANYGGRGIRVCEKWQQSFEVFAHDMGKRPRGCSLERIDNNGNYEPINCRWATQKEQTRNQRRNRILTVRGLTGCLANLCDHFNVPRDRTEARLRYGWSVEKAFFTPLNGRRR